jgi:hypothetical protein
MKTPGCLLYILLLCNVGFAQNIISGIIKDESTGQPIPYVAIGIVGKSYGTLTDQHGIFTLNIPLLTEKDTVRISAIGYENLSVTGVEANEMKNGSVFLKPTVYDLIEVKIKPKKQKVLGTSKYSKINCTAFAGEAANWKGRQAAIRANNEEGVTVYMESFHFYIIKNTYTDSLAFRLMLYEVNEKGYPGTTFLKKPVIFKTNVKEGEVSVDLKGYDISTTGDFFISLECLEDEMESSKFCFAGSIKVPSFFKNATYSRWGKVKGGGGDFNIKVKYKK